MSTNEQPVLGQMLSSMETIALKIQKSQSIEEVLNTAVITLRKLLQLDRVLIYRLGPEGSGVVVASENKHELSKNNEKNGRKKWVDDRVWAIASEEAGEVVVEILLGENLWGLLIAERSDGGWQKLEIDIVKHVATLLEIAIGQEKFKLQTGPPLKDQDGKIRIPDFTEVTDCLDRQQAKALLQQTLEQLQTVIDAVPGFVSWIGADRRYLGVNKYLASSFELSPGDFVGEELGFLRNSPQFVEFMGKFLASQQPAATQVVEATIENSLRYYLIAAQKYQQGNAAVSVGIDITARRRYQERIEASLREKEMLLREIHHRVKNNLQVVSSLLDLQGEKISEPHIQELFWKTKNRIKSMALIHETLYNSIDIDRVNFPEYINSLIGQLRHTYAVNTDKITWKLDIEQVSLNIDTAIPCGLIINELVSNVLKFAFPGEKKGTGTLSFTSLNGNFYLQVYNDGVKLPEDIDFHSPKTLGFNLVKALVRQLKGEIEIERSRGTAFKIIFPPGDVS